MVPFVKNKRKGEEGASLFSLFKSLFGSRLGCPLRERPFIDRSRLFRGFRHNGFDVDVFATKLAIAETHATVGECKKRMVFAQADVVARVPLRAALADDDVAGASSFAAELLDAEALRFRIAAVTRSDTIPPLP